MDTIKKSICGTFYGQEVSKYGKENGFVDYKAFAGAFNHIIANDLMTQTTMASIGDWEPINGNIYDDETDCYREVFQWFIVDKNGAEIIEHWTDEILYYNEELDLYLWGVTHFGTSWDYVLTDIEWMDTKVITRT